MALALKSFIPKLYINFNFRLKTMATSAIKVQVKQGTLVGKICNLPNGQKYNSFKGIPYAVPPLGTLRFKSPQPLEKFDVHELDCTEHGDVSMQRDPITMSIVGSENCLHLNVYAPSIDSRSKSTPLPVMVWIHGGGFFFGNGNSDFFHPLALMEHGVIVVTLNYRLGAFGFLALPEEGIWGNAGLKDQRLALQWVQDNISSFNGDPTNVTLFGESAGAASVHLHVYAKHAHRLFQKAILQSGTANMEWVFQAHPRYKAFQLAKLFGCESQNANEILQFLQTHEDVTPLAVLANTQKVLTDDERRRGLPLPFKPVVEDVRSPDSFIDRPILELMQTRDVVSMPIIMGYNSAEGIVMLVNAIRKLADIDKDLARFVPRNLPLDSQVLTDITQQMRDFYFAGRRVDGHVMNELVELLSDYHFTVDAQYACEWHSRYQTKSPLYFFSFDYVGQNNVYKRLFQMEKLKGACHGDEMCYLFQMEGNEDQLTESDALTVQRMTKLWTNFARTGNPNTYLTSNTTNNNSYMGNDVVSWQPVKKILNDNEPFVLDYLLIGKELKMHKNLDQRRIEYWRKINDQYKCTDYSLLSSKL